MRVFSTLAAKSPRRSFPLRMDAMLAYLFAVVLASVTSIGFSIDYAQAASAVKMNDPVSKLPGTGLSLHQIPQTQPDIKQFYTDEQNGRRYVLGYLKDRCSSIQIHFAQPVALDRDEALKTALDCLSIGPDQIHNQDSDDLRLKDVKNPTEYFYTRTGPKFELQYTLPDTKHVRIISMWAN